MDLAKYIDHTQLAADATKDKIEKLCREARDAGFASAQSPEGRRKRSAHG